MVLQALRFDLTKYLKTVDGILNSLEVCFGLVVCVLIHNSSFVKSRYERWLFHASFAYAFNGLHFFVTGCLSTTSARVIHAILYYQVCLITAAVAHGFLSAWVLKENRNMLNASIVGLVTASIYVAHSLYNVID